MINSTLSLNTVNVGQGGGIYAASGVNLTNATIAVNAAPMSLGGGIFNAGSTVNAINTIIAKNTAALGGADFRGSLISQGYNLIGSIDQTTISGTTTGNITGVDPNLGALNNNGGLTQTHALLPGSPAIDAANPANFPAVDQRSVTRPKDGDRNGTSVPDIGAFERDFAIDNNAPFDFDGDGKTDVGIFRSSDGSWWYTSSSGSGFSVYSFGTSTDIITPGDFTGDGRADISVFRPSTGFWFVQRSEDNSFFSFPFVASGDIPAPADYDGDGKTDSAVLRPSDGTWYIRRSSDLGTTIVQFGSSEDKPVAADYDGDGKADIAIFRPSDGSWWYLRSSDAGFRVYRFGVGTDKPVQGDYTGDGKTDIAVFRPSTGEWFVLRSTAGILITTFGTSGDRPIPNSFVP